IIACGVPLPDPPVLAPRFGTWGDCQKAKCLTENAVKTIGALHEHISDLDAEWLAVGWVPRACPSWVRQLGRMREEIADAAMRDPDCHTVVTGRSGKLMRVVWCKDRAVVVGRRDARTAAGVSSRPTQACVAAPGTAAEYGIRTNLKRASKLDRRIALQHIMSA